MRFDLLGWLGGVSGARDVGERGWEMFCFPEVGIQNW